MTPNLQVIAPGREVLITRERIKGMVAGISIRGVPPRVASYEIAYSLNGELKTAICEDYEISLEAGGEIVVGFTNRKE